MEVEAEATVVSFFHHHNTETMLLHKHDLEKRTHAFISSRLDDHNGLFTGLSKGALQRLQLIQSVAARVQQT